MINELLSNAYKYAFVNKLKGKIDINFFREDNNYVLIVKDNGTGIDLNLFKNSKTLGIRLINALTKQLNGTIDFKNKKGTEIIVKFPRENEPT